MKLIYGVRLDTYIIKDIWEYIVTSKQYDQYLEQDRDEYRYKYRDRTYGIDVDKLLLRAYSLAYYVLPTIWNCIVCDHDSETAYIGKILWSDQDISDECDTLQTLAYDKYNDGVVIGRITGDEKDQINETINKLRDSLPPIPKIGFYWVTS